MSFKRGYPLAVLLSLAAAFFPVLAAAQALSASDQSLLSQYQYRVDSSGGVWAPNASAPLDPSDLQATLARLTGAQRLKALLQVDMILDQSGGQDNLTPAQTEQIKGILSANWAYFPDGSRQDASSYFTPDELAALDEQYPPPQDNGMPAAAASAQTLAAPPGAAVDVDMDATPAAAVAPPILDDDSSALSVSASAPAPALAPAPAPAPVALSTATVAAVQNPAAPVPAVAPSAAVAAVVPAPKPALPPLTPQPLPVHPAAVAAPALVAPKITIAGAPPQALMQMRAKAAPVTYRIFPLPLPPLPTAVAQLELERLLQNAPYTQDVVSLLRLVSEKAGLGRTRALRFLLSQIPAIVIEPRRCGVQARSCLEVQTDDRGENIYTIVLSPGPLMAKSGALWLKKDYLLPDAQTFYSKRHLSLPDLEANRGDGLPQSTQDGPWGKTAVYADKSLRGAYSNEEMAGSLLKELLLADAAQEGWDASPYFAQVYAQTAREIFYDAEVKAAKSDDFLDPDERAVHRRWDNDANSLKNELVHVMSSARYGIPDFAGARWSIPPNGLSDPTACELRVSAMNADKAKGTEEARKLDVAALAGAGFISRHAARAAKTALTADAAAFRALPVSAAQCLTLQQKKEMGLRLARFLTQEAFSAQEAQAVARGGSSNQ